MCVEHSDLPTVRQRDARAPLNERRVREPEATDDRRAVRLRVVLPSEQAGQRPAVVGTDTVDRSARGLLQADDVGAGCTDDIGAALERLSASRRRSRD